MLTPTAHRALAIGLADLEFLSSVQRIRRVRREAMVSARRVQDGEGNRVCLQGEIDLSNVDAVRREVERLLAEIRSDQVIVDLSGLEYIDSQGVALLLKLSRQLDERQVQLRLVAPADSIAGTLLSITPAAELPVDRSVD